MIMQHFRVRPNQTEFYLGQRNRQKETDAEKSIGYFLGGCMTSEKNQCPLEPTYLLAILKALEESREK